MYTKKKSKISEEPLCCYLRNRFLKPTGHGRCRTGCPSTWTVSYTHLDVYKRQEKELGKSRAELEKLNTKLHNPGFVNKAPANVVEAERERAEKLAALIAKLEEQL